MQSKLENSNFDFKKIFTNWIKISDTMGLIIDYFKQ